MTVREVTATVIVDGEEFVVKATIEEEPVRRDVGLPRLVPALKSAFRWEF